MKFLLFCIQILFIGFGWSQSFEGKVTFNVQYPDIPDSYKAQRDLLPKQHQYWVKDTKNKQLVPMEMGGSQWIYKDVDSSKLDFFIDYTGIKMHVSLTENEVNEMEDSREVPEYVYNRDSIKMINDYVCYLVVVTFKEENRTQMIWVTDELPNNIVTEFKNLQAFPVQYESVYFGYKALMTLENVERKALGTSELDFPKGYEKINLDGFMQMMKAE